MTTWTLENAKNRFSELVRSALRGNPQVVIRGGRDEEAVVIISRADYERLHAPENLVDFLERSPLAQAFRDGDFATDDPFERQPDFAGESPFAPEPPRRRKRRP